MLPVNKYKKIAYWEKFLYSDCYYPSEIYWSNIRSRQVLESWKQFIEYKPFDHSFGLVINIPFCEKRCLFCTHEVIPEIDKEVFDNYLFLLEKECELFKDIFEGITFESVYIGGGTPSVFSAEQLERVFDLIERYFSFSASKTNMLEISPSTIDDEKINVIEKKGVTKITFGVQDINESVLQKNNRSPKLGDIGELVKKLKRKGVRYINIDLMAGLLGQSLEDFKRSFDYLNSLDIENIDLNIFKPTRETDFVKSGKNFENIDLKLVQQMINYYNSNYIKTGEHEDVYHFNEPNASFLGIGCGVNSEIYSTLYYQKDSLENYKRWLNGEEVDFKGIEVTLEDEITKYILSNLKEHGVSGEDVYELFGVDINETFVGERLDIMERKGVLNRFTNGREYMKFKYDSDLLYDIYNKVLYRDDLITFFEKNYSAEISQEEFKRIRYFYFN